MADTHDTDRLAGALLKGLRELLGQAQPEATTGEVKSAPDGDSLLDTIRGILTRPRPGEAQASGEPQGSADSIHSTLTAGGGKSLASPRKQAGGPKSSASSKKPAREGGTKTPKAGGQKQRPETTPSDIAGTLAPEGEDWESMQARHEAEREALHRRHEDEREALKAQHEAEREALKGVREERREAAHEAREAAQRERERDRDDEQKGRGRGRGRGQGPRD